MKNVLSLCLVAAILFGLGSCTKEAPNQGGQNPFSVPGGTTNPSGGGVDPEPTPSSPVGDVPSTFTKKVVIEKYTGEWCGACPNGDNEISSLSSANAGKIFGVGIHKANSDPFEIPYASTLQSHLIAGASVSSFGYPFAAVNRQPGTSASYPNTAVIGGTTTWSAVVNTELAKAADCGLAIVSKEEGDKVDIDVYVGYNSAITTTNTKVTVYLLENKVPESAPGAQASGGGNYVHNHVLRAVLTAELGDDVDLNTVTTDKYTKIELKGIDISGKYLDKNNLTVLAFVNVKGSKGNELDILNAQEVHLGETKKFD